MSLLQLIIIATLQGFTEWLPISSSAHVLLASGYFGLEGHDELLINAVSNLGTLAAMLLYFRKDVASAVIGGFELLAVAAGYEKLLPEHIQTTLRGPATVAGATIVFGALLWWADVKGGRERKEEDMTLLHAFLIGATQAVAAIIPGTSRSGITMTAARALGYERSEAARFAMLIGAPILAAAGLYGALGLMGESAGGVVTLQDGMIVAGVAFITGLASIAALMAILQRMSFLPFVLYRFALGIALILMSPTIGLF